MPATQRAACRSSRHEKPRDRGAYSDGDHLPRNVAHLTLLPSWDRSCVRRISGAARSQQERFAFSGFRQVVRLRREMKTSLGIWAFGAMATRFNPGGYKPELVAASTAAKVRTAVEGLGDLIDDYEFHYPQELAPANLDEVRDALDEIGR